MESGAAAPVDRATEREQVLPLELFFDLVFVFAFTQVTAFIAADPTWAGLGEGLLILAALWWAWGGYAWLTGTVNPEEGATRLAVFAVMAAMFVVALAVPGAFGANALLFALSYLVVRWLHLALFAMASRQLSDRDLLVAVGNLAIGSTIGPLLLILAAGFDGATQGALWIAALTIDYAGPAIRGVEGWRLSPGHFAERYGLIVIIALGESIVAIGVGTAGLDIDLGLVAAATMGLAVTAVLWWAYFDVVALVAARKLTEEPAGARRNALARDAYSYLHYAIIAGIILFALGAKKTLGQIEEPLKTIPAVALCGGVALYLLGHVGMRYRNIRTLNRQRVVTALLCLALIPVALEVDAIIALAAVTAVSIGLISYEAIRFADRRASIRAAAGTIAASALLAGAVGCGSDPLSADELISRGDEICREGQERFVQIQAEPPADAGAAEATTDQLVDAAEEELNGLEDLTPPEELEDGYNEYLDKKREGLDLIRDGASAAGDQDQDRYEELQRKLQEDVDKRQELAREVGFKRCSRPQGSAASV